LGATTALDMACKGAASMPSPTPPTKSPPTGLWTNYWPKASPIVQQSKPICLIPTSDLMLCRRPSVETDKIYMIVNDAAFVDISSRNDLKKLDNFNGLMRGNVWA
jgi:hypothetical protein